jgi:hypothetical protein
MLRILLFFLLIVALALAGFIGVSLYKPHFLTALGDNFVTILVGRDEFKPVEILRTRSQLLSAVVSTYGAAIVALVSLLVNLLLAYSLYRYVNKFQSTVQRLTHITQIENQIVDLFNERLARIENNGSFELFRFRNVLNHASWDANFENAQLSERHMYVDGDNYVLIRDDGARLSSQALHETVVWFRRVRRALDLGVITVPDLLIFWRYILPFAQSQRYRFFRKYFARYDWEDLAYICDLTFRQYYRKAGAMPANMVRAFDEEFLREVGIARAELRVAS